MAPRRTPEFIATVEYLERHGRSPKDAILRHAMKQIDPSRALRKRAQNTTGAYPTALSQQVLAGRKACAMQMIDNAIRSGRIIRHPDGTLELSAGHGADK